MTPDESPSTSTPSPSEESDPKRQRLSSLRRMSRASLLLLIAVLVVAAALGGYVAWRVESSLATPALPTITSFHATPSTIILGASTVFSVSASGGDLSYDYTGLPPGCTTTNAASWTCAPTSSGTYTPRVFVNNTAGKNATATTSLTVDPATADGISITSFGASPDPIQAARTTFLNVSASGGSGTLSYAYTGLPAECSSSNVSSLPCTPSAIGTFSVRVYVNDSAGGTDTTTASLTVTRSGMHFHVVLSTSPATCAPITFNGSVVQNGDSASVLAGSYSVSVAECFGYYFTGWDASGGASVASFTDITTSGIVYQDGSLTATFSLTVQDGLPTASDGSA
jgi:hypothetical protein